MTQQLTETEVRVLGSLIEKQLTTPEYYPLTMNALVAACSQKSNRDPVVSYDETTIQSAIDTLRDKNLVYLYYGSSSRTVKFKHMVPSVYDLDEAGTAVMAVLFLRGPQTIGEIRERTGRLHEFAGLGEVQETLDSLARRDDPLIVKMERLPGQKEARYAHLLAGEVTAESFAASRPVPSATNAGGRIEALEQELAALRTEFAEFRQMFDEFRKQFE